MFFTPAMFSPAERLQTRNPMRGEQGKIPTLFCASEQKILDAKSCQAGEHFPTTRPNYCSLGSARAAVCGRLGPAAADLREEPKAFAPPTFCLKFARETA
jgi:hypothetical protein